jgi:hypothetical protein
LQYLNPKLPVLTLVKYALTGFEDLKATPKLAITPQIVNPTQKSIFNPKVKHTTPLLFSTLPHSVLKLSLQARLKPVLEAD